MPVTMKDIAKIAGVHESTVSMVVNDYPMISQKTRDRVLDIIKRLNYHPNISARRLSKQRTYSLGFFTVVENMHLRFGESDGEILSGVSTVAGGEFDYDVLVQAPVKGESAHDYTRLFERQKIDGAVLSMPLEDDPGIRDLERRNLPAVLVCSRSEKLDFVQIDNKGAIEKTMEYLSGLGHRRIGIFSGGDDKLDHRERLDSYLELVGKLGLPTIVAHAPVQEEGGYRALKQMLAEKPTAVITGSDNMAAGAIKAANEAGLEVPRDLSIVGFDDLHLAGMTVPKLTTVKQPFFNMGVEAAKMLIARIDNKELPQQKKFYPAELIIRESTAKPA